MKQEYKIKKEGVMEVGQKYVMNDALMEKVVSMIKQKEQGILKKATCMLQM